MNPKLHNHRIQEYTEYKSCLVSVIWGGLLGCWGRGSTNRGLGLEPREPFP